MSREYTHAFTAMPETIDELGHVNNAIWVQWIQVVATAHWDSVAPPAHREAYVWVVVRHEIDYLRALGPGQHVTAQWDSVAPPAHREAYVWVVVRHEIDYLRALGPGQHVTARTWVADAPQGAKFDRFMEFTGDDGRVHVRAKTVWALLDKASGRPLRVTADVIAPFRC